MENDEKKIEENLEQIAPKDMTTRKRVLAALLRAINSDNQGGGR
jgi:hypothetical protein